MHPLLTKSKPNTPNGYAYVGVGSWTRINKAWNKYIEIIYLMTYIQYKITMNVQ